MSIVEKSKRKQGSDGRKSSVLGSLNAFLEEAKEAEPAKTRNSGDRSVMSSASKIQRRTRRSHSSGSASVFGGQVADRDEVRERRRSRSSSASVMHDGSSVSENRKELRKERKSSVRSRTPSARSRHSALSRSVTGDSSSSMKSSSQPMDHPPLLGEPSGRLQRKVSLTTGNGAEVPPGFPVAAVDKNSSVMHGDLENVGHSSGPTVLESTAKIRERQQRRADLSQGGGSSKSLGAGEARQQLRRKKSLRAMTPELPPPRSIDVSQDEEGGEKVDSMHSSTLTLKHTPAQKREKERQNGGPASLSSALEMVEARSPGRNLRKKSSNGSVASAPAMSDRNKKDSASRRKSKKTSPKKQSKEELSELQGEHTDDLAIFLGMPKPDDDDDDEQGVNKGDQSNFNALNASIASLDPSILTHRNESIKPINSIMELYHDEAGEGIEGELDLNDDSTQGTQDYASNSFQQRHGSTSQLNQSVVEFDADQLQQTANMFGGGSLSGPGYLSPQHSSLSGNSDSIKSCKSPSVLKRKAGQRKVESPNSNKRVSWIELPLASPGTLLVKSTDNDGTNERETEASADLLSSLDDLRDERKFSDTLRSADGKPNVENNEKMRKSPSLGAALEQDNGKTKRQSADERTVGTAATSSSSTSQATAKTNNKSKGVVLASNTAASNSQGTGVVEEGRPPLARTSSSSSRSSVRRTSDSPSVGSPSPLSRQSSTENDVSDKKLSRRSSKVATKGKTGSNKETKQDSPSGSNKEPHRRSSSEGRLSVPLTPDKRRTSLRRTSSDSKSTPSKAGSKIKYMSKSGNADDQVSGEPTNEICKAGERGAVSSLLSPRDSTPRKKKSYLSRRNEAKEHKSSVKSSLDNFLEKMGDTPDTPTAVDSRSVSSDGRLKNRKKTLRARKDDSDDRSVSSAPSMNARRRSRRLSGKTKGKEVGSWWNLDSKVDED